MPCSSGLLDEEYAEVEEASKGDRPSPRGLGSDDVLG